MHHVQTTYFYLTLIRLHLPWFLHILIDYITDWLRFKVCYRLVDSRWKKCLRRVFPFFWRTVKACEWRLQGWRLCSKQSKWERVCQWQLPGWRNQSGRSEEGNANAWSGWQQSRNENRERGGYVHTGISWTYVSIPVVFMSQNPAWCYVLDATLCCLFIWNWHLFSCTIGIW